MSATVDLAGLFPPIPTPFDHTGAVDIHNLQNNITRWNKYHLSGYVVHGSNGEAPYMSFEERVAVVRAARQVIPNDKLLIVGAGLESTRCTVQLIQAVARVGADAALVITPGFFSKAMKNAKAQIAHFRAVADASPIPVIVYNMPANTGVDLSAETIIELSKHPNIIGLKDSSGNVSKLALVHAEAKDNGFQVLAGSAGFLLPALAVGAVGGVCALANVAPEQLLKLIQLFKQGDGSAARELQAKLVAPNSAVTARFGVPGLKAALDLLGYYGGPVRSPLQPMSNADHQELQHILKRYILPTSAL